MPRASDSRNNDHVKAAAIILAAGSSRRLGTPKQLAVVGGAPLLTRSMQVCSEAGLSPLFVVLGANAPQIEAGCSLLGASVLQNDAWASGVASSIRVGIAAAERYDIDSAVITTCDMPFVTAAHLRALVALARAEHRDTGSEADNWKGVPACFLRASFFRLLQLDGDTGARKLLEHAPTVHLRNPLDVDTPQDLATAREHRTAPDEL